MADTTTRKRKKKRSGNPHGRPTTGIKPGELMSEYKRTTVRLPPDVRVLLKRTAKRERRQEWRVIVDAIRAYCTERFAQDTLM